MIQNQKRRYVSGTLNPGLFFEHFQKTQGQKNSAFKKTQGHFSPQNSMHRKFMRLRQKNSMHPSVYRLHKKKLAQNSLVFFMNKIDLCSTGGVKSQKCEQTIVRRTIFSAIQLKIFSNSVHSKIFQKN